MSTQNNEPVVFIVDDDSAVRDSMRMLVKQMGLRVQTYSSGEEFLAADRPDAPACLLLDIRMGGMTGTDLQEKLMQDGVNIPIIFITGYGDIPTAVRATRRGAVDFIEKPFNQSVLLERVRQAIDQSIQTRSVRSEHAELTRRWRNLSPREQEVMALVISGLTSREIAQKLSRSEKTIKAHRLHMMKKLKAHTTAELVRMALTAKRTEAVTVGAGG